MQAKCVGIKIADGRWVVLVIVGWLEWSGTDQNTYNCRAFLK